MLKRAVLKLLPPKPKEPMKRYWEKCTNFLFPSGPQKRLERFCDANGIQLKGNMGFSIDGLLVREFGYLLKATVPIAELSLLNPTSIKFQKALILNAIQNELNKPVHLEERRVAHETAAGNLKNLLMIVRKISDLEDARVALKLGRLDLQ